MKLKIKEYFNTYSITMGFFIALFGSLFIYLQWLGLGNAIVENISALLFFWFLLGSKKSIWFWSGFFIALFWFWWISVSFIHYQNMTWAVPLSLILIPLLYGSIFGLIGYISGKLKEPLNYLLQILTILSLSYLHPLGFDWFKPELVFTHTYIGVQKWQLFIVLLAITLSKWKKSIIYLSLIIFAYTPNNTNTHYPSDNDQIVLSGTQIPVSQKWNPDFIPKNITHVIAQIEQSIANKKSMIIFPESVVPLFLNKQPILLAKLNELSKNIPIVLGALYLDKNTNRNSTYIFQDGNYTVAHKVILVPFGEGNPLPDWAGEWINEMFFDGAEDYIASSDITDYVVDTVKYRNAICYEATSSRLYTGSPKHMTVISNNGWFYPSTEPILQKIMLEFYSRKYGTTIYHSANMSPSYTIKQNVDK